MAVAAAPFNVVFNALARSITTHRERDVVT